MVGTGGKGRKGRESRDGRMKEEYMDSYLSSGFSFVFFLFAYSLLLISKVLYL